MYTLLIEGRQDTETEKLGKQPMHGALIEIQEKKKEQKLPRKVYFPGFSYENS